MTDDRRRGPVQNLPRVLKFEIGLGGELETAEIEAAGRRRASLRRRDADRPDARDARGEHQRRGPVGQRERLLVELELKRVGYVGLVDIGVGKLSLRHHAVERAGIEMGKAETRHCHLTLPNEPADERARARGGGREFDRRAEFAAQRRPVEAEPLDIDGAGDGRDGAVAA